MVEKVNETVNMPLLTKYCEGIGKKEIYRIPGSMLKNHDLNPVLAKLITLDLFKKNKNGKKRYKYWKKHPVKAIACVDENCQRYGIGLMSKSSDTSSPIIKILLRLKGENKMEQMEEQIKQLEKGEIKKITVDAPQKKQNQNDLGKDPRFEESREVTQEVTGEEESTVDEEPHNKAARENHEISKREEPKKQIEVELPMNFIKEIKLKSIALAQEDKYKQELIKEAKEKGWLGVTIEEIDLDLTTNYRKLAEEVNKVTTFDKESKDSLRLMQSMRKDKMEIYKFQINTQLKLAELEEKKKMRERVTGIKMDSMTLELE